MDRISDMPTSPDAEVEPAWTVGEGIDLATWGRPIAAIPDNWLVKKHAAAITSSNDLTANARLLANLLLSAAMPALPNHEHVVGLPDVFAQIGGLSRKVFVLQGYLRELVTTPVEWDIPARFGGEWNVCTWLSGATIKNGLLYFRLDCSLAMLLSNPEIYAMLRNVAQFKIAGKRMSPYVVALYENCLRWVYQGHTEWWDVATWRRLLGATEAYYETYPRFSGKVLKPSMDTINECTDLQIVQECKTAGRRVTHIRFLVSRRQIETPAAMSAPLPTVAEKIPAPATPAPATEPAGGRVGDDIEDLVNELTPLFGNARQARRFVVENAAFLPVQRKALEITLEQGRKKSVHGGYFRATFQNLLTQQTKLPEAGPATIPATDELTVDATVAGSVARVIQEAWLAKQLPLETVNKLIDKLQSLPTLKMFVEEPLKRGDIGGGQVYMALSQMVASMKQSSLRRMMSEMGLSYKE